MKQKSNIVHYPWEKWFAKNRFILFRGKQYNCQPHSMGVQIRNAAAKRNLSVSVYIDGDKITCDVYAKGG